MQGRQCGLFTGVIAGPQIAQKLSKLRLSGSNHEIHIVGGSRMAVKAASQGTRQHVRNTCRLQPFDELLEKLPLLTHHRFHSV